MIGNAEVLLFHPDVTMQDLRWVLGHCWQKSLSRLVGIHAVDKTILDDTFEYLGVWIPSHLENRFDDAWILRSFLKPYGIFTVAWYDVISVFPLYHSDGNAAVNPEDQHHR